MQVRYCLHVQQRLLKVEWPIKLAEHHMAQTISVGDMEGDGAGGQILFNGLRVRMALATGMHVNHRHACWCMTMQICDQDNPADLP